MNKEHIWFTLPVVSWEPSTTYLVLRYRNDLAIHRRVVDTLMELDVEVVRTLVESKEGEALVLMLVRLPKGLKETALAERFRGLRGIREVRVGGERFGGVVFPPVSIGWKIGEPLTASLWSHPFIDMITRGLVEAAGETYYGFWYHAGFYAGRLGARNLSNLFRIRKPRELLEVLLTYAETLGWIEGWEIAEFDLRSGNIMVALKGNQEARHKKSSKPVCYLSAGLLAGIATEIFGKKTNFREIRCQARGDPECLFVTV